MTTHLYDPLASDYFDAADTCAERDRSFQVCSDCRLCVKFCPSFKDLFRMIDERDDGARDVRFLTDEQHRTVVDECYQCKLCYVACPYTPAQGQAWTIDFPRLMLRSAAGATHDGARDRSARLLARTDLQGKVGSAFAPLANVPRPSQARPSAPRARHRHRPHPAAADFLACAVLEVVPEPDAGRRDA